VKPKFFTSLLCCGLIGFGAGLWVADVGRTEPADFPVVARPSGRHAYPWHRSIVTTVFWVGEGRTPISSTTNGASAWDFHWVRSYGGFDDPVHRVGPCPRRFAATRNPFYVALPFNDLKYPELARKWVPYWWKPNFGERSRCKGKWVEIRNRRGKSAFAQWEDVGPLRCDHAAYVFGNDRPNVYNHAGLDVSPAVKDYLNLDGFALCDWRFVDAEQVPPGPWLQYQEQALVFAALKDGTGTRTRLDRIGSMWMEKTLASNSRPPAVQANRPQSFTPEGNNALPFSTSGTPVIEINPPQ
jgi:hypothetical protein